MKGYIVTICIGMFATIAVAYNSLEYRGQPNNTSCSGECYAEYVAINGTPAEIEAKKKELANLDEFSSIRSLWAGCAACHGQDGQGMAVFPALKGRSSDYIVGRLNAYKNRETVGAMSSTMWGQAAMLSEQEITTIGNFIQETMK
jgi:cytochrome c553